MQQFVDHTPLEDGVVPKGQSRRNNNRGLARRRQQEVVALRLRATGASEQQIAERMDLSEQHVGNILRRCLKRLNKEIIYETEQYRRLELERLDQMQFYLWERVRNGDHLAVNAVLGIMVRRAKLLDLDAPMQVDITHYVKMMAEAGNVPEEEALERANNIIKLHAAGKARRRVG